MLSDVLAFLVRVEKLTFERAKLANLLLQPATQAGVLGHLALVRLGEIFDDTLQSFKVVGRVASRAGNDIPRHPDRTGERRKASSNINGFFSLLKRPQYRKT